MTLRQSDPKVKTTGRKSHDLFKEERAGGGGWIEKQTQRQTERETRRDRERDGGVASALYRLVFLSRSDAGVCRHAWRLSRCGLQHQDHYRENKAQAMAGGRERVTAPCFISPAFCSPCSHKIKVFVTKTTGTFNKNEEMLLGHISLL